MLSVYLIMVMKKLSYLPMKIYTHIDFFLKKIMTDTILSKLLLIIPNKFKYYFSYFQLDYKYYDTSLIHNPMYIFEI